jgi:hypothetical protein
MIIIDLFSKINTETPQVDTIRISKNKNLQNKRRRKTNLNTIIVWKTSFLKNSSHLNPNSKQFSQYGLKNTL